MWCILIPVGGGVVVQAANEDTKEHLYETLLAECRDTIQAVREEIKTEAVRCTAGERGCAECGKCSSFYFRYYCWSL